ncbi:MAG: hypothetical protein ACJAUP_000344 [Cellvibrionaceae bacterium]|jgi:uncharacterized protein (TIGR02444 family)
MLDPDIHLNKTVDNNLWFFACEVYSRPRVADACLTLQDRDGVDIPLLLCCCWAGYHYGELSPELLQQASSFSKGWSANTTKPLRTIRRDMKTSYSKQWPVSEDSWFSLREQVKQLELESEKSVFDGLHSLIDSSMQGLSTNKPSIAASIRNVEHSFPVVSNGDNVKELLSELLAAIYQKPANELRSLFEGK